jgi:hypothetical protein
MGRLVQLTGPGTGGVAIVWCWRRGIRRGGGPWVAALWPQSVELVQTRSQNLYRRLCLEWGACVAI